MGIKRDEYLLVPLLFLKPLTFYSPKISQFYKLLDKTLEWLDKLREQLRISRENHLKNTPHDEIDIEIVKENVKEILSMIRNESEELGGKYPKIAIGSRWACKCQ